MSASLTKKVRHFLSVTIFKMDGFQQRDYHTCRKIKLLLIIQAAHAMSGR